MSIADTLIEILKENNSRASFEELILTYQHKYSMVIDSIIENTLRSVLKSNQEIFVYDEGTSTWALEASENYLANTQLNRTEWIISGNPDKYDHMQSFKKNGFIDWKQNNKYNPGDIVFLYFSGNIKSIRVIAKVEKVDMRREDTLDDTEFWKSGENGNTGVSKYFRLRAIRYVDDSRLNFSCLRENGLTSNLQSACRVNEELSAYIDSVIGLKESTVL